MILRIDSATPGHRPLQALLLFLLMALLPLSAKAQVLLEENFRFGSGSFTTQGAVYGMFGTVTLRGSRNGSSITSQAINTRGMRDISLTYDRTTSGYAISDELKAEFSLNGRDFAPLEKVRRPSGNITLKLNPAANNQDQLFIRFSSNASGFLKTARISKVTVEGQPFSPQMGGGNEPLPDEGEFFAFESGHVRPMALSSDGERLYVVNTPDNRVEVYDVSGDTPLWLESVPVGLEPVAVALRDDNSLWVVNHLSDSVSIVDLSRQPARVVQTLLVADEPRDIVFAGPENRWAFITAAHRGQNAPFDPQLTTPGTGRADVWVFEADSPGESLEGDPVTILNMFGDTLRPLARNGDGSKVYTAVLNSGNQSTVLRSDRIAGGVVKAPPFNAADGTEQPSTGLIVQFDGENWVDSGDPVTGTPPGIWNDRINLELPDYDVFTIDTTGDMPEVVGKTTGVGTTLFNLAVNPVNNKVYVSNQEALNLTRFEGKGLNSTTLRGHFVENRITVIDNETALPRHLNKHIDYSSELGTAPERDASLAIPLEMAVTADGKGLYVAAMGSGKIGYFDTEALENDTFEPSPATHLELSAGGPTGIVLDEARNRAFVTTRFDNGISVVALGESMAELAHVQMHNPEPESVVAGRPFLYDARHTSSRGDSSCAGCQIFGDMDHLSWDLGDPDKYLVDNPNAYNENIPSIGRNATLHPMKGPMMTQSLRGMRGKGPMHWRGDRTGQNRQRGETLEEAAFKEFNEAFVGLLGREQELPREEMDKFTDFALQLSYPPNPIRKLDNSLTPVQAEGEEIYHTINTDLIATCNGCHKLSPEEGFFGTDGTMSIEGPGVAEDFKIPHLRNMYQKIGMFADNTQVDSPYLGNQIRGFGFDHQGSSGSVSNFLDALVFNLLLGPERRVIVEQFVLAFPSELNPIVGQQLTISPANHGRSDVQARLLLLEQRAAIKAPRPECDLIANAVSGDQIHSWVMNDNARFVPANPQAPALSTLELLSQFLAANEPVTFTCTPPGSGVRIAFRRGA